MSCHCMHSVNYSQGVSPLTELQQDLGQPGHAGQPIMDLPSNSMGHWTLQSIGNQRGRVLSTDYTPNGT